MLKNILDFALELAKNIGWLNTLLVVLNGIEIVAIWNLWKANKAKDEDCRKMEANNHLREMENLKVFGQLGSVLDRSIQKSGSDAELIKTKIDHLKDLIK